MSIAKQTKLREYGTDLLSHDTSAGASVEYRNVRINNTFKSSVMDTEQTSNGFVDNNTRDNLKSRERTFKERPLTAKVQRASY